MLSISPARGSAATKSYHAESLQTPEQRFGETVPEAPSGEWHGRLAEEFGMTGVVQQHHYERLADGQHPLSGEPLVRSQPPRARTTQRGEVTHTMVHRSSWELIFSAPKSVSLTAVHGGDDRVRAAHQEAVTVALHTLEKSTQAHSTQDRVPEMTGNWAIARFDHDTARPVQGYAAPQIHTHAVLFNITHKADGTYRALEPREIFRQQKMATDIYRSELTHRLKDLGYQMARDAHGAPQIQGYSPDHLRHHSPRRQQVEATGHVYAQRAEKSTAVHQAPNREIALAVVAAAHAHAAERHQAQGTASVAHAHAAAAVTQQLSPQTPTPQQAPSTSHRPVDLSTYAGSGLIPNQTLHKPWQAHNVPRRLQPVSQEQGR